MSFRLGPFILTVIASICQGLHEKDCNVLPKDLYIEVGSNTQIMCHTCGHNKVNWTLNNREIDKRLSNTINSTHTVLSLKNFTEHSATLQCLSTETGVVLGGTTIKTFSKPTNISCILDYIHQNATGVPELLTCSWEHLLNPSKDVTYSVLSTSWFDPSQSEICNSHVTTCTSNYKRISDKISLFGGFNITVRAKSAAYEAYSETQEFISFQIWKIVRPRVDVNRHHDGILVNWTQMDGSASAPCNCQVKYSKIINNQTQERVIDKALNCEERGKVFIDNLEICSTYKVSIRCALEEAPWSDWSLEKRVLTKLNMTNLKVRLWRTVTSPGRDGFRKVHVMWKGIPSTCEETLTYTIRPVPATQNTKRGNYTETVCGNSTCDVEVNQDAHRVHLTVFHNDAQSVEASVYVPAPGEGLPQVTDIKTLTHDGVIVVSWKAPAQPVSGYMIDYTHDGDQYNWRESKYTNITLTGLLDKKQYNITVTPLFSEKTGHGTQARQICSRVGDPGNVTIIDVQALDKSAFVSWEVKPKEACSGHVVKYIVFYSKQKGPQLNVTVDGTKSLISLKDLTPDTQYQVYVKVTALTGTTESTKWLFMTKKFDPQLITAVLVCGSIATVLVLFLGLCCAVQWKKFKEKPVPDPGLSSVALWSTAAHQEGTCPVQPFSTPHESSCDRVYPEELGRTSTPRLPRACTSCPLRDQTEEYTVPDVVPATDLQTQDSGDSEESLNPSSPGESTALLLADNNQCSPYRSQSSEEAAVQKSSKQNKRAAVKEQEKTIPPTVYVTLDMFEKGKLQLREMETKP